LFLSFHIAILTLNINIRSYYKLFILYIFVDIFIAYSFRYWNYAYIFLDIKICKFSFNIITNIFIANIFCTKFYSVFYNVIKMKLLNEIFTYFVLYIYLYIKYFILKIRIRFFIQNSINSLIIIFKKIQFIYIFIYLLYDYFWYDFLMLDQFPEIVKALQFDFLIIKILNFNIRTFENNFCLFWFNYINKILSFLKYQLNN